MLALHGGGTNNPIVLGFAWLFLFCLSNSSSLDRVGWDIKDWTCGLNAIIWTCIFHGAPLICGFWVSSFGDGFFFCHWSLLFSFNESARISWSSKENFTGSPGPREKMSRKFEKFKKNVPEKLKFKKIAQKFWYLMIWTGFIGILIKWLGIFLNKRKFIREFYALEKMSRQFENLKQRPRCLWIYGKLPGSTFFKESGPDVKKFKENWPCNHGVRKKCWSLKFKK